MNFIATEFIDGETLRQLLKNAPMKLGAMLDAAVQIANALSAAHDASIVHRDIKSENVMLRTDNSEEPTTTIAPSRSQLIRQTS